MISKPVLAIATAAALTVGAAGVAVATSRGNTDPEHEQAAERAYTDAHRDEVAITQADAERRAQEVRPGDVVESHLENEGGGLRWEVKTDDGTHMWEVQLDPDTGAIVSNQAEE